MAYAGSNPWDVPQIDSFNFLCCPECVYRSKEESTFQAHAVQNHPRSRTFFNREQPGKKEIGEDLFYCCPECDFKSQEPNKFQIHALQKHPQSLAFFTGDQQDKSEEENKETLNPWEVKSLDDFSYYCCTECSFRTKEAASYRNHNFVHMGVLSTDTENNLLDGENHEKKEPPIKEEPYFDGQGGMNAFEPNVDIKVEPDAEHEEKYDTRIKDKVDNDWMADEALDEADLDAVLDNDNNDEDYQPDQEDDYKPPKKLKKLKKLKIRVKKDQDENDENEENNDYQEVDNDYDEDKPIKRKKKRGPKGEGKVKREKGEEKTCRKCEMRRAGQDVTPDIRHTRSCPDKHLEKKTYSKKCEYCDKIIVMNMKRHVLDVHVNKNIKPFKCTMCSFCSHAKRYLLWHVRRHHNPNHPPGSDKDKLKKLSTVVHKPFACDQCPETFPASRFAETNYIKHYRTTHNGIPPDFLDKKQYHCSQCPEIFFNVQKFKSHESKHHGLWKPGQKLKQYQCKTCLEMFSGKRNYIAHCEKSHNEIIPLHHVDAIKCHSCEMIFSAPNYYITHHQSVHGTFPPDYEDRELFICDQCPQVYISKTALSAHIQNVHNKEFMPIDESKRKTWHCPHCEKVFKTPQAMKEHVVVKHDGTATQKCDECQRSFGTYSKLRDHKKLVHERVKCQECGQEICNYFMLKRHRATVHGIKPKNAHQCEFCPMFFSFRASLHKHVQSKHQANNV